MISVVIPVYKKVDEFVKNLEHNWKYLKGTEVIVINDDPSSSIKNRLQQFDLQLIENAKNLGFAGSVDKATRSAKNNFVFLLNSDVKLLDSSFTSSIKKFEKNKMIFAVTFAQKEADGTIVGKNKLFWKDGLLMHSKADNFAEGETGWAEGGSSIIRKDIYEKIGGFDTIFSPFYWEDIELCYRAKKYGYICWYDPTIVVEHHHESTIGTYWSKQQIKCIAYRNQLLATWKNIKGFKIISHCAFLTKHVMRSVLRGDFAFIQGFLYALPFLFNPKFYKIR